MLDETLDNDFFGFSPVNEHEDKAEGWANAIVVVVVCVVVVVVVVVIGTVIEFIIFSTD
jgi:uncharacterized membrane protein required for colicin V production